MFFVSGHTLIHFLHSNHEGLRPQESVRLLRSLQGLHACGAALNQLQDAVGRLVRSLYDGNIWQWLGDTMATEGEENE